jgi:hypothetical protein
LESALSLSPDGTSADFCSSFAIVSIFAGADSTSADCVSVSTGFSSFCSVRGQV